MKFLLSEDGQSTINFPINEWEINSIQFRDLKAKEQQYFKASWIDYLEQAKKTHGDDLDEDELLKQFKEGKSKHAITEEQVLNNLEDSVNYLIDMLSVVCSGDLDEIPLRIEDDNIKKLFHSGFYYAMDNIMDTRLSLLRIYVHIINIIQKYKPQEIPVEFKFEWLGETYYIDPLEAFRTMNGVDYSSGETITILDFRKRTIEQKDKKGDVDGNFDFALGCRELAVLLRKKNEKLPFNRRARINFIDQRANLFATVPLPILLNVRFFLRDILIRYDRTQVINGSLKNRKTKVYRKKPRKKPRKKFGKLKKTLRS